MSVPGGAAVAEHVMTMRPSSAAAIETIRINVSLQIPNSKHRQTRKFRSQNDNRSTYSTFAVL